MTWDDDLRKRDSDRDELTFDPKKKKSVKADVYAGDTEVDRLYIASQDFCFGFG